MIMDIVTYLLPYVGTFAVAFVLGRMSRNSLIDRLNADLIRTRTAPDPEPVPAVQPRTRTAGTRTPMYGPEHAATRTEPLPAGVRYVMTSSAEEDKPMTDAEYAAFVAQSREG